MARLNLRSFYPGSDVRGLAVYGDVVSQSSSPAELSARLNGYVDELASMWAWAKAKIIAKDIAASYFSMGLSTDTAGLQTIDNVISLKRKSIADVLGGSLTLEKWLNGVEVARAEIENYIAYVNGNASALANIRQLGRDLKQTAADYGTTFVQQAKKAAALTGLGLAGALVIAGLVVWKIGLPLLGAYLGVPRRLAGYGGRRRRLRH